MHTDAHRLTVKPQRPPHVTGDWRTSCVLSLLTLTLSAPATGAMPEALRRTPVGADKKLIDWCTYPLVTDVAKHTGPNEKKPFAGMVLRVTERFADDFFGAAALDAAIEGQAVEHLKSAGFQRYTDNFIWVKVVVDASDADRSSPWLDEARWQTIVHNAQAAARIAKRGGLKGVVLDTAQGTGRLFDHRAATDLGGLSFEAHAARVRQRGAQLMRALGAEYPDITLLLTMATSAAAFEMSYEPTLRLEQCTYGLLPAFVDGLIDTAGAQARLVDGYRRAFHFTDYDEFVRARAMIKNNAARLSADPDRYREKISVAFGINFPLHALHQVEDSLHHAQFVTDQYVWVWHHHRDRTDPLAMMDRSHVFAILNSRLARTANKPTPISDLKDYWGLKGPVYHAARLESLGFAQLQVARLGSVNRDESPQTGAASFAPGTYASVSFDYNLVSMVVDLGAVQKVDVIHIYGGQYKPGNVRLDETNVSLYVSDDNVTYRPIHFTYHEPDPHVIELTGMACPGRYFKIAHSIRDASYTSKFTAGTDFGGAKAFVKR